MSSGVMPWIGHDLPAEGVIYPPEFTRHSVWRVYPPFVWRVWRTCPGVALKRSRIAFLFLSSLWSLWPLWLIFTSILCGGCGGLACHRFDDQYFLCLLWQKQIPVLSHDVNFNFEFPHKISIPRLFLLSAATLRISGAVLLPGGRDEDFAHKPRLEHSHRRVHIPAEISVVSVPSVAKKAVLICVNPRLKYLCLFVWIRG